MDFDGFIQKEIAGDQGEDASQSEQRYPKHKHKCNGMKQDPDELPWLRPGDEKHHSHKQYRCLHCKKQIDIAICPMIDRDGEGNRYKRCSLRHCGSSTDLATSTI